MVFNGQYSKEVFTEYGKWLPWIQDIVMPILDSEKGDWLHLPFDGSVADQPYISFTICRFIQSEYKKFIHEKNEQMMKKMRK